MEQVLKDLQKMGNPQKAKTSSWFFKTGKGQYGEGDKFIGLTTPEVQTIAKKYKDLPTKEIQKLLNSEFHECRTVALILLIGQYPRNKQEIFDLYLKNTARINNWDLVDISAPKIVGDYLLTNNRSILYKLAVSKSLWERRIAIISTFTFIRETDYADTLRISQILMSDKEDLIHKAVGWMLREVGKHDQKLLEDFLEKNIKIMPRTSLRYAIEKFPEEKRKYFLRKE
jgi:3-methyladenine DNA glycosylase AlkD